VEVVLFLHEKRLDLVIRFIFELVGSSFTDVTVNFIKITSKSVRVRIELIGFKFLLGCDDFGKERIEERI